MEITKTIYAKNRIEWRKWLEKNYDEQKEIWLIYYKKHTGKPRIPYNDAVEEALCFGWIDSTIKRIDDEKYCQKFTPRNHKSGWSESNILRMKKLIKDGKMTDAGMAKFKPENKLYPTRLINTDEKDIPSFILDALKENSSALEKFRKLAPSHKRNYLRWITEPKREETREKRLAKTVELLSKGKTLGMV
ncbi:MAG: hypothetical protein A2X61_16285 [Ignavibacteria bacterium GWB2_35_12]|nr:MAG: hypothetical protein A2X61_16285 [Ignavibacteria bacterium GWB2_35_12]OGU86266.1 MAG: hypothetical protein A2220_10170 [Ignavibacteria bacterium RIFOXYA2_FULL_35_10]OGV21844.1 MAG: hypothetical protein A2475_11095 [Ignavibacteria bacterium RIFOXYC2_FULL_35_21]